MHIYTYFCKSVILEKDFLAIWDKFAVAHLLYQNSKDKTSQGPPKKGKGGICMHIRAELGGNSPQTCDANQDNCGPFCFWEPLPCRWCWVFFPHGTICVTFWLGGLCCSSFGACQAKHLSRTCLAWAMKCTPTFKKPSEPHPKYEKEVLTRSSQLDRGADLTKAQLMPVSPCEMTGATYLRVKNKTEQGWLSVLYIYLNKCSLWRP